MARVLWRQMEYYYYYYYSLTVFIQPVEDFNVTTTLVETRDNGSFMNLHLEWPCSPSSDDDVEYIVTITDVEIATVPNCTTPGLNPPCFVVRDTVSCHSYLLDVA